MNVSSGAFSGVALHPNDHLAELGVGLDESLGLRKIREAVHPVDERLDAPGREIGKEVGGKAAHGGRALLGVAVLVRNAEETQPLRMQIGRASCRERV